MSLALFSSHNSISCAILTTEKAEDIDVTSPISIFSICKSNNITNLKLVENSFSGFYQSYILSEEYGIKLQFGLKVKVCNDLIEPRNSSSSIIIWIKNSAGYKDLLKINDFIQNEGFILKDLQGYLTWEALNKLITNNLLVTIPFYSGFLAENLTKLGHNSIPQISNFKPIFLIEGHDLPFDNKLVEITNKYCKDNDYNILTSHSIYYYNDSHAESLQIARCINQRSKFEKPELAHFSSDKFSFESYVEKYGKNFNEDNFNNLFEKYDIKELKNGVRLPEIEISKEEKERFKLGDDATNLQYITAWVKEGLKKKILTNPEKLKKRAEYIARCKEELLILNKLHLIDYILLVAQILNYAQDKGIPTGAGRGSSAGSLVAYLLNIVHIDPLDHGLYFSRFISESRAQSREIDGVTYLTKGLPDVDSDIDFYHRDEIIKYIQEKYKGKTSKIGTVTRLTGKSLIKEVTKTYLNYSEADAQRISKFIEKIFGVIVDLKEAYKDSKPFTSWVNESEENKKCYEIACNLENLIKSYGTHPSGIAISYGKIGELVPLVRTIDGLELSSAYSMDDVSNLLIKLDILGLKSLSILVESAKLAGLNWREINVNDPSIYKFLQTSDNFHGLFQIEKGLGKNTIIKVKPDNQDHLAACISIGRPGAMKSIDDFAHYKKTGEYIKFYDKIDEYLKRTGGIIIYQEQINEICQNVYELSGVDADKVEYCIRKKKKDEMEIWQPKIYSQGEKLGIPKEITDKFWTTCVSSSDYLFCASHGFSYANLCASMIYMKANYPLEFFTAVLRMAKNQPDPIEEISFVQRELAWFGLELLPPSIKTSKEDFEIESKNIRFGLSSIKGISDKAIIKLSSFNRDAATKFDLFNNCKEAKLDLRIVGSLILAGTLPDYNNTRAKTFLEYQIFNLLTPREIVLINKFGDKFNYDICAIIKYLAENKDDKGKLYIKESRMNTIRKDYKNYKSIYEYNTQNKELGIYLAEKAILGFSYSNTLQSIYAKEYPEIKPIYDAITAENESYHTFIGTINEIKEGKSKAGNPYIKMEISDDSKSLLCMAFNERMKILYDDKKKLIEKDTIVIIKAKKISDEMFFADWCKPLLDVKLVSRVNQIKDKEKIIQPEPELISE